MGEGTPQDGSAFDNGNQLRQMQSQVQAAAPGDRWTGGAADAYADTNSRQAQTLGKMAELDQRLGAEINRSAEVVMAGRRNLDDIKQWVTDAASSLPDTPNREQQLLPITRKGISDVTDVLQQTNRDLNAVSKRIQTIGNEYQELGGEKKDDGDPSDQDPVSGATRSPRPTGPPPPHWTPTPTTPKS